MNLEWWEVLLQSQIKTIFYISSAVMHCCAYKPCLNLLNRIELYIYQLVATF